MLTLRLYYIPIGVATAIGDGFKPDALSLVTPPHLRWRHFCLVDTIKVTAQHTALLHIPELGVKSVKAVTTANRSRLRGSNLDSDVSYQRYYNMISAASLPHAARIGMVRRGQCKTLKTSQGCFGTFLVQLHMHTMHQVRALLLPFLGRMGCENQGQN